MADVNKYRKQIDSIMDWFEFERVHTAMVALDWSWCDYGIPSVPEIRAEARDILEHVIRIGGGYVSTGGFKASLTEDQLSLEFIVSDWQVDLEEI